MYPRCLQYAHQCDDSICVHHHHFSPWHYLGEHCTSKRNRLRLTCRAWSRRPAQDTGTGTCISFHSAGSTAHQNQSPNKPDVYTHSTDCDWIGQHGGLAAIVISKEVADAGKAVSSLSTIFRRRGIGGFQKLSAGWGAAATPFFGRVEIAKASLRNASSMDGVQVGRQLCTITAFGSQRTHVGKWTIVHN